MWSRAARERSGKVRSGSYLRPVSLTTLFFLVAIGLSTTTFAGNEKGVESPKQIPVANLDRKSAVDFESEVLPFLRVSCLAYHNKTKAKAKLVLETPADIRRGGESGPA